MSALEVFVLPTLFGLVVLMFGYWAVLTYRPKRLTPLERAAKRLQNAPDSAALSAGRSGLRGRPVGQPRPRS